MNFVAVEAEGEEVGQTVDRRRNLPGEVVVGQIEAVQSGEGRDRRRKLAGEVVVREVEELESGEVGEAGNVAVETVTFEAQDSEFGERV